MSYQYNQFGTGFDLMMPEPQALRFEELLQLHGEDVTVIQQTVSSRDAYGQPVTSEATYAEKAVIKTDLGETILPPGEVKRATVEALFTRWAPISEAGYELEIRGHRYHVVGVEKASAYLLVRAGRVVE
jgi:hypothetical protein